MNLETTCSKDRFTGSFLSRCPGPVRTLSALQFLVAVLTFVPVEPFRQRLCKCLIMCFTRNNP
ncbi:uncharacterized protein Bfra_003226 [Botrytis fragariae]|uniref:Uncharacterized protein n=1 Tax=Botrytis fragariae TaxID=1964551 RepID=A0A8H6AZT7_9HELO|nr:uncharacterized protein Bfra_003226 [Botrytis fragariae]KAF5876818.1 hypothetical protein Bfra_003226 [Botrytis fragariae]